MERKEDDMQEMPMLKEISGHSVEAAIGLLNELKWSISVVENNGIWSVAGGHRLILQTSSPHLETRSMPSCTVSR